MGKSLSPFWEALLKKIVFSKNGKISYFIAIGLLFIASS